MAKVDSEELIHVEGQTDWLILAIEHQVSGKSHIAAKHESPKHKCQTTHPVRLPSFYSGREFGKRERKKKKKWNES